MFHVEHRSPGTGIDRPKNWRSTGVPRGTVRLWETCAKPQPARPTRHIPPGCPPSFRIPAVDNSAPALLTQGLARLHLELSAEAQVRLLAYADELLKWNEKVSLTAITRTDEVVDKHLLDSLAVLPEIQGAPARARF